MDVTNGVSKSPTGSTQSKARYPKAIFLIIATEFCERFSFCGLRTILSLYLRNNLLFAENSATIIYHVFIMLCYFVPILGATLADSFLGRFRTIFYFSFVYTTGNILLSLAAMPSVQLPPVLFTMLGLVLIAFGTGGIKPCVAAFGGDQFRLPLQQVLLEQFFSIFYFTINFGGLFGMIVTPILRKTVHCFGSETCYAVGFGFPAFLMLLALLLFISGKTLYRIKFPKENVILQFVKCMFTAIIEKMHSEKKDKPHWLDYAENRYSKKLIEDMKIVLAILFLYAPLPVFWSLFDQQGSRWTFQASRTNGQVFGLSIQPDQLQVINPAIVLLLIPLFDKYIYPAFDKFHILTSPLHRIACGGVISSFAFIVSGVLEIQLEESYPVLPQRNEAHINFINLLPCQIQLINPFNNLQPIGPANNFLFQKVVVNGNYTSYDFEAISPYDCGAIFIRFPKISLKVILEERQTVTILMSEKNQGLVSHISDPETSESSLSGKPKIRIVLLRDKKIESWMKARFTNRRTRKKPSSDIAIPPGREVYSSNYLELHPAEYECSVYFEGRRESYYLSRFILKFGGVYSLTIQEQDGHIIFAKLLEMTPPNRVSMLWMVPQYALISIGEVMFAIAGLQFSFTQAPKSMKTVTIAAWYLSVAVGNLFVIIVTQLKLFHSQANEFFFFAFLAIADMVIFLIMANHYKFSRPDINDSSSLIFGEENPKILSSIESINVLQLAQNIALQQQQQQQQTFSKK